MKLSFKIIVFLSLFFSLFAQNSSTIAVLDLDAEGISTSESRIISARLRTDLFNTGKFTVIERDKMQDILDEQGFQLSACTTNECVVEVGKLIGVEKMVAGNIGKIGKLITLTIRLVDVETGKVLQTATEDCRCDIETVVTQSVKNVAEILAGNKIQTETYNTSQKQSKSFNDTGLTEWEMMGLTREEYINFKRSGLTNEQWLIQYEYKNSFYGGLKSLFFPGWGQLSVGKNSGYFYIVGEALILTAIQVTDTSDDFETNDILWISLPIYHLISMIDGIITTNNYNEELKKKYKVSFAPKLNKYSKQPLLGLNINF